jgi:hypothetical protein
VISVVVIPGEQLRGHPLNIIRDWEILADTENGDADGDVDKNRVTVSIDENVGLPRTF